MFVDKEEPKRNKASKRGVDELRSWKSGSQQQKTILSATRTVIYFPLFEDRSASTRVRKDDRCGGSGNR